MSKTTVKNNKEITFAKDLHCSPIPQNTILYIHGFAGDTSWFVSPFPQSDWHRDFALNESDFEIIEGNLV